MLKEDRKTNRGFWRKGKKWILKAERSKKKEMMKNEKSESKMLMNDDENGSDEGR